MVATLAVVLQVGVKKLHELLHNECAALVCCAMIHV